MYFESHTSRGHCDSQYPLLQPNNEWALGTKMEFCARASGASIFTAKEQFQNTPQLVKLLYRHSLKTTQILLLCQLVAGYSEV